MPVAGSPCALFSTESRPLFDSNEPMPVPSTGCLTMSPFSGPSPDIYDSAKRAFAVSPAVTSRPDFRPTWRLTFTTCDTGMLGQELATAAFGIGSSWTHAVSVRSGAGSGIAPESLGYEPSALLIGHPAIRPLGPGPGRRLSDCQKRREGRWCHCIG